MSRSKRTKEMMSALKNGDTGKVADLVLAEPELVVSVDKKYRTPLHVACKLGHMDIAEVLIAAHSNVDARNCWGHTPLHTLCHLGNSDGCHILVRAGASMSILDNLNYTALDFALHHNQISTAILLIQAGSPVNVKGPIGGIGSPLHWACKRGNTELVRLLVERGASAAVLNFWRRTPDDTCSNEETRNALRTALARRESQQGDEDSSFADIYRRPRDDSVMQGIDRAEQEEVRTSYQTAAREHFIAPGSGVAGGSTSEIYSFLKLHCSAAIPTDRLMEIVHSAKVARITTMGNFAKALESGSSGNAVREKLRLTDFELASLMRVLEEHNLLLYSESNDFLVNGLMVHNVTPLQVATSVSNGDGKKYTKGIFVGQVVTTDTDGELRSQQVCLKSNIGTVRDVDAEIKIFKEVRGASGVVEMVSHGRVHHGAYLVTEWFGYNLTEFLSSSSFVSMEERIQLFTELCGAVCSLHSRNIMHGDLCPDNVLVDIGEFGLSVMLCDLSNARRVGELFPYNPTDGLMTFTPGYCAPEVYFGSARQCRSSTKIDVFCLGLIGGVLLSRSDASYSGPILPMEPSKESENAATKNALRDQEIMNSVLADRLQDIACKDVVIGMCNLTPANRGDVETAVNILQTRTSIVERNFDTSFSDLYGLLENLSTQLEQALLTLRPDFIFRDDMLDALVSLSAELQRSYAWAARKVGDPKECLRVILGLSIKIANAASKKLPEEQAAEATSSIVECVTNISGTVDFADGHDANTVAADKLSHIRTLVEGLVERSREDKAHMEALGDAVQSVFQSDEVLNSQLQTMKSDAVQMSRSQSDQVAEITQSIKRMEQSLAACEGINMGLMHFMRGELNSQYDKLNDVLRRTHYTPHLFLLLPKIEFAGQGNEDHLMLFSDEYKLHFLCSQTYRIIPCGVEGTGYSIRISRDMLHKIAPLALVCLTIVRTALVDSSGTLGSVGLPRVVNTTARHSQFLDFVIQSLLHPPAADDDDGTVLQQEIEVSILDSVELGPDTLRTIRETPVSPEVASLGYETLRTVLDRSKVKLSSDLFSGMRLVLCQGKIGWVMDTDAAEASFMGL